MPPSWERKKAPQLRRRPELRLRDGIEFFECRRERVEELIEKRGVEVHLAKEACVIGKESRFQDNAVEKCALEQSAIRPMNEQHEITFSPETECAR
jgi:hypothetical protein